MTNLKNKNLILVVEDENIPAVTLKEKLTSEDFEVIVATDGEEGFKMAISKHPDLILLDLLLPKLDGLSLLRRLHEDSWGSKAKVIILSNISDPRTLTKDMDIGLTGISEYMLKTDWTLDEVVSEVKRKLI